LDNSCTRISRVPQFAKRRRLKTATDVQKCLGSVCDLVEQSDLRAESPVGFGSTIVRVCGRDWKVIYVFSTGLRDRSPGDESKPVENIESVLNEEIQVQ
jgi:hypothetical protein